MKHTYKILFVASIFAFALNACKKIEIKPKGTVEASEAIKTERDVKDILNGAYGPLPGGGFYGGRLQKISEYMADAADGGNLSGYERDIFQFKSNPNSGTTETYKEPYVIIQRTNVVLENLSKVTSSAATANNYKGQALFLRGICHFELVKLYAQPYGYTANNTHNGIVIRKNSNLELGRARNTVAEVYAAIISDLKAAADLLPASNGNLANKWAAEGYLARVYFQMNKFDSAYKYADDVITNSSASFDYTSAFVTNRFDNPVSQEAVFYLVNETVPSSNIRFGALRNDANPLLGMSLPITAAAYTAGNNNTHDLRKAWYSNTAGIYGITKYKKNNFILPLLHITELKLIRAESAVELNQNVSVAISDINDITTRAYDGFLAPLDGTATLPVIKARIRTERKLEMIYESCDRLQEIKRIGAKGEISVSHDNAPWDCNGMALQFPASEFNVNANFAPNPTGGCL